MSEERITRRSLDSPGTDRTNWEKVDSLTDEDIAAPILDDNWFKTARVVLPPGKAPISIRIDRDVLEWFRASGEPYQTRINAVLRAYMEHERSKSGRLAGHRCHPAGAVITAAVC